MHLLSLLMKFIARDVLGSDVKKHFYAAEALEGNRASRGGSGVSFPEGD